MDGYYWGYIAAGIAILLFLIVSVIAEIKVHYAYDEYKKVNSSLDLTGAEFAKRLADDNGIKVRVSACRGTLSDNYNPSTRTLNISTENYSGKSIAAQAIVAHEFGHALQHAKGYFPLKMRQFAIRLSQITSTLFIPLLIVGILLEIFLVNPFVGNVFIYVVAGLYGLTFLINVITLKVEYNASARAKELLKTMYNKEEMVGVNKVLDAAALTYLASMLVSLAFFIRILLRILMSRK